jgi:hypothetical protein
MKTAFGEMPDDVPTTPEYAHDIRVIDAEPWNERTAVDKLINLQDLAFRADSVGRLDQFGSLVLQMSQIEHAIGNHSEAAAYASEAAGAFVTGGHVVEAVSAHATHAKECCTLESPDLALASLEQVLSLRTKASGHDGSPVLDASIIPVLRLSASFMATYSSSWLVQHYTDDSEYPAVVLPPKTPKPSRHASQSLLESFDQLLDIPLAMDGKEMTNFTFRFNWLYKQIARRRFGLPKAERKQAETTAELISGIMYTSAYRDHRMIKAFDENAAHGMTLRELSKLKADFNYNF